MLRTTPQRSSLLTVLVASILAMPACDGGAFPLGTSVISDPLAEPEVQEAGVASRSFLRLYTRNVFLGASTAPLFSLDFSQFPANILEVVAEVQTYWAGVQATDFTERAEALADEIASIRPHVVGLNEMARYALIDLAVGPVDGIDFYAVLMDALAARGLDYTLEIQQIATSSQLPYAVGPTGVTHVLTFEVGDGVLVRGDVEITDKANALYAVGLDLGPVQVNRGWSRVSFPFQGITHHVVVTHLEQQILYPIQEAQVDELLGSVLAGLEGPTFLMGDLNSDANNGPPAPSWTPTYGRLVEAGWVDPWLEQTGRATSGETCCWDDDLIDGALDQRIDFILVRAPEALVPGDRGNVLAGAAQMDILGEEESDRTPVLGIFPADHAGLFGALHLPRGLLADR